MEREVLFSRLYYQIGKQLTNFALQHSRREGEQVVWTKRKTFLALDPDKDNWFINNANHRQILLNEIILDFDRPIKKEEALYDKDIRDLVAKLKSEDWRFIVYHTGSKGLHIHIFWTPLSTLSRQDRESFRQSMIKDYSWFSGLDLQKSSDQCMIALEHTPHWKTGIPKTPLLCSGEDTEWN